MIEIVTPNGNIQAPEGTSPEIILAIKTAAQTRFCSFTSDLVDAKNGLPEYAIEAFISRPCRDFLDKSESPKYKVRYLIPKSFPYKPIECQPLDPDLKWNPHQNGNWSQDPHANIICPPSFKSVNFEELFLPYIRHSFRWLQDAEKGKLSIKGERFELPHLYSTSSYNVIIEGGREIFEFIKQNKFGQAKMAKIKNAKADYYLVKELSSKGPVASARGSLIETKNFDLEDEIVVPWFFAGDSVVSAPHKALQFLSELDAPGKRNFLNAVQFVWGRKNRGKYCLVAFELPNVYGGQFENIVWKPFELTFPTTNIFIRPKKGGFRPLKQMPERFPIASAYINSLQELKFGSSTSSSRESLFSRSALKPVLSNKKIVLLGVGAIGAQIYSQLMKHHFSELTVIDSETYELGNHVRHPLPIKYIGCSKAESIIKEFPPLLKTSKVVGLHKDVLYHPSPFLDSLKHVDIIIDCTGNRALQKLLYSSIELEGKVLASFYINPGPDFGFLCIKTIGTNLSLQDIEKIGAKILPDTVYSEIYKDPSSERLVWDEPGCYHPTFEASYDRICSVVSSLFGGFLRFIESGISTNKFFIVEQKENDTIFETKLIKAYEFDKEGQIK